MAKKSLQLSIEEEDIAMIKADAKAMGKTPGAYVTMVCKMVNDAARPLANQEFIDSLVHSVTQGLRKK